jgi:hypothetical protein
MLMTIGEEVLGCVAALCEPDSGLAEPADTPFPWLKADDMLEDKMALLRIVAPGGDKGISK